MNHPLYHEFFRLYHEEKYWEAHEALEELWQTQRDNDFYHGLIQVAAIMHQLRRGKIRGARKLAFSALRYLSPFVPERDGVKVDQVVAWLNQCLRVLPENVAVMDESRVRELNLPVCPLPRFSENQP
jgi:predicted metal-dependent hydrolase